jgi:two-component system cell cycle response regulator DivK
MRPTNRDETCDYNNSVRRSHPIEVLYVEDSLGDVCLTKQIFADFLQPVKLWIARDGEQALTMLADPKFKPAVIILDLNLPVLSGFTVLERNPRKDIPVVVFSGSTNKFDVERTLLLGAKEYVQKPMDMHSYQNAIIGMVRNWAMANGTTA